MRVSKLHIQGYRSLADLEIPLYNYTILIGRNNSGKSSVLLALKLLFEGTTRDLKESDFCFHDLKRVEQITIEATLEGVGRYLSLCDERHRTKIENYVFDDSLRIRRMASYTSPDSRKPELGKLELWQPSEQIFDLPTGIESALKQLLPEIIFIEAFKDPSEETQAKGSATLGKLLKQIIEQVSLNLSDVKKNLDKIARRLNVIEETGKIRDKRPKEFKRIEDQIKNHMRAVFKEADFRLNFRLPEISDLMESVTVELRDRGPWTPLEGKGQGFQRTLYLALLRTLAEELRETRNEIHRPFLLLYEEPETFLHPALQREMGDILENISNSNQVVVATHSPLLVNPQRIQKVLILQRTASSEKDSPKTRCLAPDFDLHKDPNDKQLVNLLKFSSSAEFLFADHVLVVEGPSDRALVEASWYSVSSRSQIFRKQPGVLAIVEAGSKHVVPVWVDYLKKIGLSARGLVDLDFLWDGAGKCLNSDSDLSQFTEQFWNICKQKGIAEVTNGTPKIQSGKKPDALRLISKNDGLKQKALQLRERLKREASIWVLAKGEIEDYFKPSGSSKGKYVTISQKVRTGEVQIPSEINEILKWVVKLEDDKEG